MAGFKAMNADAPASSARRFITDRRVVERALAQLKDEFGWGRLAGVAGEVVTGEAIFARGSVGEKVFAGTATGRVPGGWWLILPEDYPGLLHNSEEAEFRVRGVGAQRDGVGLGVRGKAPRPGLCPGVRPHCGVRVGGRTHVRVRTIAPTVLRSCAGLWGEERCDGDTVARRRVERRPVPERGPSNSSRTGLAPRRVGSRMSADDPQREEGFGCGLQPRNPSG